MPRSHLPNSATLCVLAVALFLAPACGAGTSSDPAATVGGPLPPHQVYPLVGGTPEWAAFETHDEMIEAVQLPSETLRSLPTQELLEVCVTYPLFPDVFAFNTVEEGSAAVMGQFHGFEELFSRADAASVALETYESLRPSDFPAGTDPSDPAVVEFVMRHALIQYILADARLLGKFTEPQLKQLAEAGRLHLEQMLEPGRAHLFGGLSLETSALLAARARVRVSPAFSRSVDANADLAEFVRGRQPLTDGVLASVLAASKD